MAANKKVWLLAEYWASSDTLELAQNAFLEAGALGIEIDDGLSPEHPPKYENDAIRVLAYFEHGPGQEEKINNLFSLFFMNCDLKPQTIIFNDFFEDDWQASFLRSCTTFRVEPGIFIVPSFEIEDFKKKTSSDLFIEMDPENAFGTGQHQTTKLCLKHIAHFLNAIPAKKRAELSIADIGTGSGILAILAKKLEAGSVVATEIDHDAVETAKKNALKNMVELDISSVPETHNYQKRSFDMIVANILANTLIDMAKNLTEACKEQGTLILSGILCSQAQSVIDAYERLGTKIAQQENMDDWCVLVFTVGGGNIGSIDES